MKHPSPGIMLALIVSGAGLQAQQLSIPIRHVSPVVAKTTITFARIPGLRELPGWHLLVNDVAGRQMLVFDSTLTRFVVAVDSTHGAANSYPRVAPPLISYLADSTLFFDIESQSLILIEPSGRVGRSLAPPRSQDVGPLFGSDGRPVVDNLGRLLYRASVPFKTTSPLAGAGLSMTLPDSAPLVRADFSTHVIDTIAHLRLLDGPKDVYFTDPKTSAPGMRIVRNPVGNPVDDWTVTSNGTIAIVRGQDYHIDWISPDGARRSSSKMPFDWRRLTDAEKQAKIDTARRITDSVEKIRPLRPLRMPLGDGTVGPPFVPVTDFVAVAEIPDYVPPIRPGAVKADLDGNVWILPSTSSQAKGGLLYDVVNQKGELFERVQLPAGCDIAGFGREGVLYLTLRDERGGYFVETTRVLQ